MDYIFYYGNKIILNDYNIKILSDNLKNKLNNFIEVKIIKLK